MRRGDEGQEEVDDGSYVSREERKKRRRHGWSSRRLLHNQGIEGNLVRRGERRKGEESGKKKHTTARSYTDRGREERRGSPASEVRRGPGSKKA